MPRSRRQNAGFTLLEILVASAMTALLAAALYTTLFTTFKARRNAEAAVEQTRGSRLALDVLARDFQAALPPGTSTTTVSLAGAFLANDSQDGGGRTADVVTFYSAADGAQRQDATGDVQQVSFAFLSDSTTLEYAVGVTLPGQAVGTGTTTGGTTGTTGGLTTGGAAMSNLQVQPQGGNGAWRDPNAPGDAPANRVLVRRTVSNLLSANPVAPKEEVLCRGVAGFNVRYFDGTDWQDSWDSTAVGNVLPVAVEITLDVDRDTTGSAVAAPRPASGSGAASASVVRLVRIVRLRAGKPVTQDTSSQLSLAHPLTRFAAGGRLP